MRKLCSILLAACLVMGLCMPAFAESFTDAHGNVIELDDTLEAYTSYDLSGADNAARKGETNLGDLWTDALLWFAASGRINEYFEEDDVTAGNNTVAVDADHMVALWNGGNLRDDIPTGKFGAQELANVLPYPNKVAVIYMTGAQLLEALEAAAQGMPFTAGTADCCASFMQAAGLKYTVDIGKTFDAGEAYGKHWAKANSVSRVTITEVNGQDFDADATYAVITHNANFNGMDSSYIFKEAAEANEKSAIATAVVRDVVWMYIDEVLENMVGDDYAAPQGRIELVGTAPIDARYAEAVAWAVEKGLLADAAALDLSAPCTRAQAVTFLWQAAGSPSPAAEDSFADVKEGDACYDAVLWAAETGVTKGTTETTFSPEEILSRGQAAALLYRAAGSPAVTAESPFTDVAADAYYSNAVVWAVTGEIASGASNTAFGPDEACTCGQVLTFLYNSAK